MVAENTRFNTRVYIAFKYIEEDPVLHMVDDETHFSAAQLVEPPTPESVWETIVTYWDTVYSILPNH